VSELDYQPLSKFYIIPKKELTKRDYGWSFVFTKQEAIDAWNDNFFHSLNPGVLKALEAFKI
jgi:hypothetical protein